MVSINDITKKTSKSNSPAKKKTVLHNAMASLQSEKLGQPLSLKDYEEWMKIKAGELKIENLQGSHIKTDDHF